VPAVRIMGVLNVTPDSFSDGGRFLAKDAAIAQARAMIAAGADILDVGGESTRPGAETVPENEELDRVLPVIDALASEGLGPISIDTRKAQVAERAVAAGAGLWNDVSALTYDAASLETAARLNVPLVLMHAQGDPKTMQQAPQYEDVVEEVAAFLLTRREAAVAAGVPQERIVLDPGIGFGKTLEHNLALLAHLERFTRLGPVLLGASRKRFVAALDPQGPEATPADARLGGSLAAVLRGFEVGVSIIRVHDVRESVQALAVARAVAAARGPAP